MTTDNSRADALTEALMTQAQVFASAWSLVGGPFDHGNALETAEQEKSELRNLIGETIATLEQPPMSDSQPAAAPIDGEPAGWQFRDLVEGEWTKWRRASAATRERYKDWPDVQFRPLYLRPAPSPADERAAFDVALTALAEYQRNWDTGLPAEYAQGERIQMECAVEAVREALEEARAASASETGAEAVAIPVGYALVPIEPTSKMRKAAADAWLDCGSKLILNKAAAAARAAIAAAPSSKEGS